MTSFPDTMPMTWSKNCDRPDDTTHCACCDKFVAEESRHHVEVSGDMGDAIRPGVKVDPNKSGGWFVVGPDCAKKYLPGFTTK
jgi:hypothetical protein